jgi:hypothetical protein
MKVRKDWRITLSSVVFFLLALLALSFSENALAQIPRIPIPIPDKNPFGSAINLKGEEPVSTTFKDAKNEVVLQDSFSPKTVKSLLSLPIGPGGGFLLQPGTYEAVLQSFCLQAGTHGPTSGDGYLYAPLKGSKAAIIRSLLRGFATHPEIPQNSVQSLIWAIEARAKISNLAPDLQETAFALLSKKELLDANGGALGLVPDAVLNRALGSVPPGARRIFELQAVMRKMLANPDTTFAEIEQVAVLTGPAAQDGPVVPSGRWSAHPGGFFVRYLPTGYAQTKLVVYVPEPRQNGSIAPSRLEGGQYHFLENASMSPSPAGLLAMEYDPSADVAVPANTGAQRLGLSRAPKPTHSPRHSPTPTPSPTPCGDHCKPAPACKRNGRCVKGVCKFDNFPKCSECRLGSELGQCDGNGSCVPFGSGSAPTGTIEISGPQSCSGVPTLAITKEATFTAKNVKDEDTAVAGCPAKLDKVSNIRWTFSDGIPTSATGNNVKWKAPDTPATVTVKLEGDDDGLWADDGAFVQLDVKSVNAVIPTTDISEYDHSEGCSLGKFRWGWVELWAGVVKYESCDIDFSGLTVSEGVWIEKKSTNKKCNFSSIKAGTPPKVIGAGNRYCCDELFYCKDQDVLIPEGGCTVETKTRWRIGPANKEFVIHTNRFYFPPGNSTTNPPGGMMHMETKRTP